MIICSHEEPKHCTHDCNGCMFAKFHDCLNCAHSFSDEQDRLHCSLKDEKIVDEDYWCKDWN